jgi:diguanylate cyclase (GGDEF)-like protein
MLSESTRSGGGEYGSLLLQLLHARSPKAKLLALAVGATLIALLALLTARLPAELPIALLFLFPVVMVSWYAGASAGFVAALAASGARLAVDLLLDLPHAAPMLPLWTFGISLGAYAAVARVLPGLRETVFRDRELAITDPLTSLGNRRLFGEVASIELNRTRRYQRPLALVYLNVDRFEQFNERHGYAEGDALLVLIASLIRGSLRTSDVVARIAADEFAVLLPETHAEGARVAAEKIHQNISRAAHEAGYSVTFSIAAITFAEGPVSLEGVLRQADALMGAVKRTGGDEIRVSAYEHPVLVAL